jgi:hypothetical protein
LLRKKLKNPNLLNLVLVAEDVVELVKFKR